MKIEQSASACLLLNFSPDALRGRGIADGLGRFKHEVVRLAVLAILLCSQVSTVSANPAPSAIAKSTQAVNTQRIASPPEGDWLSYGLDYHEQRFSRLNEVTQENVEELGLAWHFDTLYNRGLEATPIVVDGVMFVSGNWSVVYALDATTGEQLWQYDPKVPKEWGQMACCDVVNRGVAVYEGKVLVGTLDARLVALDAATGEVAWEVSTADTSKFPYSITGAPRAAKGKVFIGNGGAEFGARGYVSAYDVNTGELEWRFFTVPGNPAEEHENPILAMAADTWTGQWWKNGGGGTVWDSIVYDPDLDQLYIGVGNGSPWNRRVRSPQGGDNLFLSSIVALDPDSGEYLWHYQETPAETWDYTATQPIMLAEMQWQGTSKKVIWHAPKNGFFFIIDRTNGQLLSAEPFAEVNWASHYNLATGRPVENPGMDYASEAQTVAPSPYGAHNWHPMSYHPTTGLVYIPTHDIEYIFEGDDKAHQWGQWNTNTRYSTDVMGSDEEDQKMIRDLAKGSLTAWSPIKQQVAWSVERELAWNGGTLSTAGDLLFQGLGNGVFEAMDPTNGSTLWSYPAQAGIVGSPISYAVNGEQYIAVTIGWGGILAQTYGLDLDDGMLAPPSRVLAFKLGGHAVLPPLQPAPERPRPPGRITDNEDVLNDGAALYAEYCQRCHGQFAVGNGTIPDLRRSQPGTYDALEAIVLRGGLSGQGMPGFSDVLSSGGLESLKAYLLDAANDDWEQKYSAGSHAN